MQRLKPKFLLIPRKIEGRWYWLRTVAVLQELRTCQIVHLRGTINLPCWTTLEYIKK